MYSKRKTENIIREFQGNLIFIENDMLNKCAADAEDYSEELRITCIAELFSRWFVSREEKLAEIIDQLLPNGERRNLGQLLDEDFLQNPGREQLMCALWKTSDEFSLKCQSAVRERLIRLCCETDGFIPVYSSSMAFFLPFRFVDGPARICDMDGEIIANWQESYKQIVADKSCIVQCHQQTLPERDEKRLTLKGNSFMLPVLLAYWRNQGKLKYNHLRLLATGAFENNMLKAVEIQTKAAMLKKCFKGAYFFFSESTRYIPESRFEIPLPVKITIEVLLQKMPEWIDSCGLIVPTLADALKRLEQLESARENIHNKWQIFFNQVDLYSKNINKLIYPDVFMLCLMLKSATLCHLGRTQQALELNRRAQKFARENRLEKQLRRMEIEELVELQDKELFVQIRQLSEPLRENIEALDDPDLLMRYYGTMGQAHCYGFAGGIDGFDCELGKEYFKKAVHYAAQTGKQGEIAQDLNYLYLWYALFDPYSPEAEDVFEEAKNHIVYNLQGNPDVQKKNKNFLYRFKAFGMYRYLLKNGELPPGNIEEYQLPSSDTEPWLLATVKKYTAALYAHAGNTEAENLFAESEQLLNIPVPIFQMLRMTVWAEKFRSLNDEKSRQTALELAEKVKTDYPSAEKWIAFLRNEREFPGLEYWY